MRKYPRLQTVINIDLSSKINFLRQRNCQICNPKNAQQPAFPIFHFVLRIRGRSRQSITSGEFRAYQLAIRQHLNKHQNSFKEFPNYCLSLTFILKKSLRDKDIDNMSKTMMDAVSRALGFNDVKVSHLDAIKLRLHEAEECVYLRLGPSYLDSNTHDDVLFNELHQIFAVGPALE
jgi:Holliday junction resolvase RusA-like endonuclease